MSTYAIGNNRGRSTLTNYRLIIKYAAVDDKGENSLSFEEQSVKLQCWLTVDS